MDVLKVFVPIGRMSLTNYISQTIFFTLIFFHWFPGLRLFGKLTLTETSLIAIVIFAIQTLLSNYWLKTYSQGPLEYIWKRLSYN